jgi:predicted transposase/invertase (TIGR01784 family)
MKKNLVRFDWAIKKLLRQKANFGVLEGFLSELLKEDVKIKNISESEGNKEDAWDKFNRVDIFVQNTKGELIIIELQVELEHDYFHRMLYGTSKAVTEYIGAGQPYEKVKKVYSVSIVYFELGQGKDYAYQGLTQFIGINQHDILTLSEKQKDLYSKKNVADIFPEYYLLKVNNFNDVAKNGLDEWMYFFKHSEVKTTFTAKGLQEANKVMDTMKLTPKQQKEYNQFLNRMRSESSHGSTIKAEIQFAHQEGLEKGEKVGLEKGEKAKAVEIAKNLLKAGMSPTFIADTTGLTFEEIAAITTA